MWIRIVASAILWGGLIVGSLQVSTWEWLDQHSFCGVWGCGPPNSALLSIHLLWFSLLAPPMIGFACVFPDRAVVRGLWLTGLAGLTAAAIYATWDTWHWAREMPAAQAAYAPQRWCFDVVTLIGFPTFHLALGAAAALLAVAWIKRRKPAVATVAANDDRSSEQTDSPPMPLPARQQA